MENNEKPAILIDFKELYEIANRYAIMHNLYNNKGNPNARLVLCDMYNIIGQKTYTNSNAIIKENKTKQVHIPMKTVKNIQNFLDDMNLTIHGDTFEELLENIKKSNLGSDLKAIAAAKSFEEINKTHQKLTWTLEDIKENNEKYGCDFITLIQLGRNVLKESLINSIRQMGYLAVFKEEPISIDKDYMDEHCEDLYNLCERVGKHFGLFGEKLDDFAQEAFLILQKHGGKIIAENNIYEQQCAIFYTYVKKTAPGIFEKIKYTEGASLTEKEDFKEDKDIRLRDNKTNVESIAVQNLIDEENVALMCQQLIESGQYSQEQIEQIEKFAKEHGNKKLDEIEDNTDITNVIRERFKNSRFYKPEKGTAEAEKVKQYNSDYTKAKRNIMSMITGNFSEEEKKILYRKLLEKLKEKNVSVIEFKEKEKTKELAETIEDIRF